ncbi:hypothetical protein BG015_008553 [Linnemannia schmuckeri]|uniref:ATP-dependent DNA ligase family profile domain-containing protein n=1 Tax=Linnemannia schmuckeri TaxID=64567 RepID=A0A9P5RZB5_9FUNG|nr:hypothetical protein BG015_008553 [Linnemannia schmuckeri]
MFVRTRTICTRCLLKSPLASFSLPEAGLLRSGGLPVRSQLSTSRSTTTRTQVTASPLVASNSNNNIHQRNSTLTSCRGMSTSATSAASSKKKNPPPPRESVTKQPSSPPAPASKKTKTSNKKASSTNSTQLPTSSSSSTAIEISNYRCSKTKPHQDLDRLQAIVDQLVSTNAWVSKRDILAQHPEQAPLLAWIYDPQRQFYARPANIIKYAQRWARQQDEALAAAKAAVVVGGTSTIDSGPTGSSSFSTEHPSGAKSKAVQSEKGFDTLSSLLEALSSRSIVGHASLEAILTFMDRYCGPGSESSFEALDKINSPDGSYSRAMAILLSTPRSKLLLKVLDKNLKAGCGIALIREAFPTLLPGFHVALGKYMPLESARELFEQKMTLIEKSTKGKKSIKKNATISDPKTDDAEWLGSRKLDGVRCLVRIDRRTGNITTLSRSGRVFEGTGKIQDSFRSIMRMGHGDDEDRGRDEFFRQAFGLTDKDESALPEALILDGEMCVFMAEPFHEQPAGSSQSPSPSPSPSTSPVLVGLLDEDGLGREQFTKAITFVTRGAVEASLDADDDEFSKDKPTATKTDSLEEMSLEYDRPIYCIFDCLTDNEFKDREGTRPLLDRIGGVTRALMQSRGVHDSGVLVKVLSQTKVESFEQLQKMVTQGVERGWEGVILRKNVGYEGKRSRNLLKFKEFQEAEFTVEEATLGTMRLPLNGQFEERYGLTSVTVVHRGNRVGVGSGFTAEERIRFGKDPSLIVGKTITVKYFEESKTYSSSGSASSGGGGGGGGGSDDEASVGNDRVYRSPSRVRSSSIDQSADDSDRDNSEDKGDGGDAVWSLRFPIVKAIYGDGPREL